MNMLSLLKIEYWDYVHQQPAIHITLSSEMMSEGKHGVWHSHD
jgi:hypothetical protein